MNYLTQWESMFSDAHAQQQNAASIHRYYDLETEAYRKILAGKQTNLQGTFSELSKELGFGEERVIFMGFLDGINSSLKQELPLAEITDDSELELDIDFNELFLAMRRAKAKWLYELPEWEDVLSEAERQELIQRWREEVTRKHEKIGRNDPCPCGSNKKYKKCCGK